MGGAALDYTAIEAVSFAGGIIRGDGCRDA
jgi:hypothetical protein